MLDLPRFAVLVFDREIDSWRIYGVRATYDEADELLKRARSKGETDAYLTGLAWIAGPP